MNSIQGSQADEVIVLIISSLVTVALTSQGLFLSVSPDVTWMTCISQTL